MSSDNPSTRSNEELRATSLFDVSHITAVVTGGGTGIGLMITQALVSNGAKVYITGRREEVLENTVKQYNTGPGSLHALPGDVSSKEGCMKLAKEIEGKESKGIQLLVNNAGIARDDNTKFCMLHSGQSLEDWYQAKADGSSQRRTASLRCPTQMPSASTSCNPKSSNGVTPLGQGVRNNRYIR
ncbi:hypothetical protein LTR35_009419 [Friedmanniomyces endolithicus]|uniref:Uncharacterized protein n=2 Tax=Friedmanniomyces endolithicus TaxID=329885 RepID=A0AAN6J8X2_9PEZI|nr:hypothetical protein LTR35_009419 [Friedmanniomyces endolithicus]KAK0314200.1 hypothetical protein LTR82_013125 [Friedmanniomyces endolithicus]KAK0997854.1 hypothetical protein LTR54_009651 [Friedmanniomyces endolithicus]